MAKTHPQTLTARHGGLAALARRHAARGTAVEIAYWTIRDAIRTGTISAGARLGEVELSRAFGVSRTPVHEALRRLEAERLIGREARGWVVPAVTLEDLVQIFEIRETLDGLAARCAAMRTSPVEVDAMREAIERTERALAEEDLAGLAEGSMSFHEILRAGSKNARLPYMISLLYESHRSIWLHQLAPERVRDAVAEHRAIFEAIASHDAERAEQLAREHTRRALRAQIRALKPAAPETP